MSNRENSEGVGTNSSFFCGDVKKEGLDTIHFQNPESGDGGANPVTVGGRWVHPEWVASLLHGGWARPITNYFKNFAIHIKVLILLFFFVSFVLMSDAIALTLPVATVILPDLPFSSFRCQFCAPSDRDKVSHGDLMWLPVSCPLQPPSSLSTGFEFKLLLNLISF